MNKADYFGKLISNIDSIYLFNIYIIINYYLNIIILFLMEFNYDQIKEKLKDYDLQTKI